MVFLSGQVSINDDASQHAHLLIHAISVEHQPTMKVNIHNQCSGFKLLYPRYFSSGADWYECSGRRIDVGSMMSSDFEPLLTTFGGVLTYMLQKEDVSSSDQPELSYIRLFVVWKSEGYRNFRAFVRLIEYDEKFCWNIDRLKECYQRYTSQLSTYAGPVRDTWLVHGVTVLITGLELDFTQRDGVLNITISEGSENEHARRPERIDPERCVPLESKRFNDAY
jgi:hypothetical protein